MARTPAQALAWAAAQTRFESGMCLKFVRTAFGVGPVHPTAAAAWAATRYRHTGTPPAGVPVWWTGGRRGFGHVVISAGGGYVYSTDVPSSGRVGRIKISSLTAAWGHTYQGWSEDINGVRVYRPPAHTPPPAAGDGPVVDLSKLINAARVDPPRASDKAAYPSGTRVLERALVAEGLLSSRYRDGVGHFGSETVAAYAAWQRRCGYAGRAADGVPGLDSLRRLGRKRGFRVTG